MNSWPMPPYERLLVDVNQLSYHNTVAVRNEDGAYWLGHIQDIVGDYTLIHFACKKVHASWIHAGRVWPLSALRYSDWKDVPVMVALRDEDDGPLRFRRAVVLNNVTFLGEPNMYYIRTDVPGASSGSSAARTELVDVCQIVGQSAWDEPALLYRSSGLIFRKHFIPFARAQEVLRDRADKSRIIQRCCRTYRKDVAYMGGCPYYDRFHLRTEASGCTFIIISRAGGVETEQQSVAALSALLQAHVDSRADRPPTDYGDLCGHGRGLGGEDMRAAIQSSDTVISDLPLLLLCEVFAHHDLHSCMRLKRVCALWLALLSRPQATEHISICFETCSCTKKSPDLNYGKVASLLSRTVNAATKSITVLQLFSSPARLRNLLVAMGITVPTIMFKGCTVTTCAPYSIYRCYGAEPDRLRYAVAMQPAEFDACCRRVLLYNWTVYEMFGDAIFELFYCSTPHVIDDLVPLPPDETQWMARLKCRAHVGVLAGEALRITIPQLVLHSSDGHESMAQRFMWALDSHFPPLTDDVYAKVTAVHARWVRNLQYPAEWDRIRAYLTVFSGFHADGTPKGWNDVDLRTEDVRTWSRLAVCGINDVFRV